MESKLWTMQGTLPTTSSLKAPGQPESFQKKTCKAFENTNNTTSR